MSSQIMPNTNCLRLIASPQKANLDIIAVHGMNLNNSPGHSENTWTHGSSKVNWLEDLLPQRITDARIFEFRYNANIAFDVSSAGVQEQAKNLLVFLKGERTIQNVRPIIFIAHSLGGLIVKEALATAFHDDTDAYPLIWTLTRGIVFFGVPHRGSKLAERLTSAARYTGLPTDRLNKSFLDSVLSNSQYNKTLNDRFEPLLEHYKFFTFCETQPVIRHGCRIGIIVHQESAVLGLSASHEVTVHLSGDHTTICKFESDTDPNWVEVSKIISSAALSAVREFQSTSQETQEQDDALSQAIKHAEGVLSTSEASVDQRIFQVFQEINSLNGNIITLIIWVWWFVKPIMFFLARSYIPSYASVLLPSRGTIMDKAEEAHGTQEKITNLHKSAIQILDSKQSFILHDISMLSSSAHYESSQGGYNQHLDSLWLAEKLQYRLDRRLAKTIREQLYEVAKYKEAQRRLELIEEGQKAAEGKDSRQIMILVGEMVEKGKNKQIEATESEREAGCSCWV